MEKKTKEQIARRFFSKLKDYRNTIGFTFFDTTAFNTKRFPIVLADNELPIVLIKLKRSKQILITTTVLYVLTRSSVTKIEAKELKGYTYLPFENALEIRRKSFFHKLKNKFELMFLTGTIRVEKTDSSFIDFYIPIPQFLFVLETMIENLKTYSNYKITS